MNIVKQLFQEINHLSNIHGPHWVLTEYCGEDIIEGTGNTAQMIEQINIHKFEINDGLYLKYSKGRFIHNEESFTNDWSRITTETAIIKVVFPKNGNDVVWLLAPQHPFP
tara:strand:+ start:861 stop:1190 length:330 start_codon:yes stop_codon:yes gene_type:complete